MEKVYLEMTCLLFMSDNVRLWMGVFKSMSATLLGYGNILWTGKALPTAPAITLLGFLIGLDNEKYAMTSRCPDRKEVPCTT